MKKTTLIIAACLLISAGAANAQSGFIGALRAYAYGEERYNDSLNRINEMKQITYRYISIKADLAAAEKDRHQIERFTIGRTQEEKITQEWNNDKLQDQLRFKKLELETTLRMRVDEFNKYYGNK